LWRTDLGSAVARLVVGPGDESYSVLDDGSLVHVSPDGAATWRIQPSAGRMVGACATNADAAVLAAMTGGSIALIGRDGDTRWQLRTQGSPVGIALDHSGRLLVSTEQWVTYAFAGVPVPGGSWPLDRGTEQVTGVPPGVPTGRPAPSQYEQSQDNAYLSAVLSSPYEEYQLDGLAEITRRIGSLDGSYPYVLDLCENVALSRTSAPPLGAGIARTSDQARREAISLLGRIGDLGTARVLLRLLRSETQSSIRIEILGALAELGTDVDGNGVRLAHDLIRTDIALGPSNQTALAVMDYLEALFEYEGGFPGPDAVELLTEIAGGPYNATVRQRVLELLRTLSRGS
jgi:hypothetical protein